MKKALISLALTITIILSILLVSTIVPSDSASHSDRNFIAADIPDTPATHNEHIAKAIANLPATTTTANPDSELDLSSLMYGQQVRINDGAIFYDTLEQVGSGSSGVIQNYYNHIYYIAGFARIDTNGQIVETKVNDGSIIAGQIAPSFVSEHDYTEIWIAIATNITGTDNVSWVSILEINWRHTSLKVGRTNNLNLLKQTDEPNSWFSYRILCDLPYKRTTTTDLTDNAISQMLAEYRSSHQGILYRGSAAIKLVKGSYERGIFVPTPDHEASQLLNDFITECRANLPLTAIQQHETVYTTAYANSIPVHVAQVSIDELPLIIVTDTYERSFSHLDQHLDVFTHVYVLDLSGEAEINPSFRTEIETAYGPISTITSEANAKYHFNDILAAYEQHYSAP